MNQPNPFYNTDACVSRLFQEYLKHDRLIIAVDFDDTVFDYHEKGYSYEYVWAVLKRCLKHKFFIVPFTASSVERYGWIVEYFKTKDVPCSWPNQNPVPGLAFGSNSKMYYNLLLDDRAGLGQALEILVSLLNKIDVYKAFTGKPETDPLTTQASSPTL